jgi:3-isopropylmalate/(R)-2-methylmalate dehydratase small subunit
MKEFNKITSHIIPLVMKDVDTDMIIPAQFMTKVNKEGYGEYLFTRLRDGDASFVFNQPQYKDAQILLSGSNFGCGSSREVAVWALQQAGISVIIAESFSDIFHSNAAKNGLLLIQLPKEVVNAWMQEAENKKCVLTVDLEMQTVCDQDGEVEHFEYDTFRKSCLLKGYDDMDYLLAHLGEIEQHEQA